MCLAVELCSAFGIQLVELVRAGRSDILQNVSTAWPLTKKCRLGMSSCDVAMRVYHKICVVLKIHVVHYIHSIHESCVKWCH